MVVIGTNKSARCVRKSTTDELDASEDQEDHRGCGCSKDNPKRIYFGVPTKKKKGTKKSAVKIRDAAAVEGETPAMISIESSTTKLQDVEALEEGTT